MLRRTLVVVAAATVAVGIGQLPAGAGSAAGTRAPGKGHWTAGDAQAFWTPERMAAATAMGGDPGVPAVAAGPGDGQDFDGVPVVGRLFVMKDGGGYFCTASVVASAHHDLVLGAAHCLLGADTRQVAFVPHYTAKTPRPYGMFPVLKVWVDPRYQQQGPDLAATLDVAFARVGPNSQGTEVEDAVGGNRLVTGDGYEHDEVRLIGYPASAARPRVCVNRTTKFTSTDPASPGSFLRIDCTGYPGGTSGGPFLKNFDRFTNTGDVVGVIGGWKTGGPGPDTSYSAYFGTDVRNLYQSAVDAAR
ncbi:trypsin-like peptidase domain-containing protein [Streptomyces sp. NBC_00536]|uniref:trypsin-like serine protease n=1 Tax=Streptomyces sp. NBC_00536 TaxID=2975769 RepID=UPI002E821733|nr:hypothetical protein [Streptomyces sp. NBC_00536]WUC82688.1 trypsin-like peptidase domain-containing protein [Streptomyces sp. NBC_00536]